MLLRVSAKEVVGAGVFGSLVCGTFGLGVWQAQRYQWKVNLIEERRAALSMEPGQLGKTTSYQRIVVSGKLGQSVRVGPRPAPTGLLDRPQGMSSGPIGYEIVSEMTLDDGKKILVNRGWAPQNASVEAKTGERVTVTALKVDGESKTYFSPVNTPQQIIWLEKEFIAKLLGCDALLLTQLADDETHPTEYPLQRRLDHFSQFSVDPETHAAYALTWFGLSVAGFFMTRRLLTRKPPTRKLRPTKNS